MKLLNIIKKNLKTILRSRSSAFIVLLGPLLLAGIIALAFSSSQEYKITVGIVASDIQGLTQQFINQIEKNDYNINNFQTIEECTKKIKLGTTNVCIKFPENFVLENNNNTKTVEFYVDQSRINLVEAIVSSVSSTIAVKSDEISLALTTNLIDTIELTSEENSKQIEYIQQINDKTELIKKDATKAISKIDQVVTDLSDSKENIQELSSSTAEINTHASALLANLKILLNQIEELAEQPSRTEKVEENYNDLSDIFSLDAEKINSSLIDLNASVTEMSSLMNSDDSSLKITTENILSNIESMRRKLNEIADGTKKIKEKIDEIQITSASKIIKPFEIEVNPLLSISNTSTFMFPYLLTLIILFVGIMLSSSLVVMEKKSRAFFRTFTTPTSELYHLLAGYITNLFILIIQIIIILTAAFFYLKMSLLSNYAVTILIIFLASSLFILLGMVIGFMFKTQEGTTIASISMGSVFLFLSNLILPVESFPKMIQQILLFNPFVLCSELFKKSILFEATFTDIKLELLILLGYVVFLTILVIIFQKISFNRLFTGFLNKKILQRPHITKENYFMLQNGFLLKNIWDLYNALNKMKDKEFDHYVNKKNNEFAIWVKDVFKEKKLAKQIKKAKTFERIKNVLKIHIEKKKE